MKNLAKENNKKIRADFVGADGEIEELVITPKDAIKN